MVLGHSINLNTLRFQQMRDARQAAYAKAFMVTSNRELLLWTPKRYQQGCVSPDYTQLQRKLPVNMVVKSA
jgi:hypothetical protein